jgi:hypothetical protein
LSLNLGLPLVPLSLHSPKLLRLSWGNELRNFFGFFALNGASGAHNAIMHELTHFFVFVKAKPASDTALNHSKASPRSSYLIQLKFFFFPLRSLGKDAKGLARRSKTFSMGISCEVERV